MSKNSIVKSRIFLVTLCLGVVAGFFYLRDQQANQSDPFLGTALIESDRLEEIDLIRMIAPNRSKITQTIELKRLLSGSWIVVSDQQRFLANHRRVWSFLKELSTSERAWVVTKDPYLFPELGLSGERTLEIGYKDSVDRQVFMIGKLSREQGTYIRKAGQQTAYMMEVPLRLNVELSTWEQREFIDGGIDVVQSISLKSPEQNFKVSRPGPDSPFAFEFHSRSESSEDAPSLEIDQKKVMDWARSLVELSFSERVLLDRSQRVDPSAPYTIEVGRFDGTRYSMNMRKEGRYQNEKFFVTLRLHDIPQDGPMHRRLRLVNDLTKSSLFAIPGFTGKSLVKREGELTVRSAL